MMNAKQSKINKVKILGSGTSTGIPLLGCDCEVCKSKNPKNKRLRTSILVQTYDNQHILVDTTPDLRTQLLREDINFISNVIITHDHADHLHGIDDLRPFTFKLDHPLEIYTHPKLIDKIKNRFPYIFCRDNNEFKNKKILGGGIPKLKLNPLPLKIETNISGHNFTFFSLPHGHGQTLGFKQDKFAYIIDCHEIPEDVVEELKESKLELLIIDCVDKKPHNTHLYLEQSIKYVEQINPKDSRLIHMGHYLSHEELNRSQVKPTFDGELLEYQSLKKSNF